MVDVSPAEFCARLRQQFANPEEGRRAVVACERVFEELFAERKMRGLPAIPRPEPGVRYGEPIVRHWRYF